MDKPDTGLTSISLPKLPFIPLGAFMDCTSLVTVNAPIATVIKSINSKGAFAKVSRSEFARILLHLSQRRGFRSNRKNPSSKEDGALLKAVSENAERMEKHGYRTVGEMLLCDEAFKQHKRNKGGNYLTTVTRDMVADEATIT